MRAFTHAGRGCSAWSEVDGIEHVVLCNGKDTDASLSKFAMPNTKTELELLERILVRCLRAVFCWLTCCSGCHLHVAQGLGTAGQSRA